MSINFTKLSAFYSEQAGVNLTPDEIKEGWSNFTSDPKATRCFTLLYIAAEIGSIKESIGALVDKVFPALQLIVNLPKKDLKERLVQEVLHRSLPIIEGVYKEVDESWSYSSMQDRVMTIYNMKVFMEANRYCPTPGNIWRFVTEAITVPEQKMNPLHRDKVRMSVFSSIQPRAYALEQGMDAIFVPITNTASEKAAEIIKKQEKLKTELEALSKGVSQLNKKRESNSTQSNLLEQLKEYKALLAELQRKESEFQKLNAEAKNFSAASSQIIESVSAVIEKHFSNTTIPMASSISPK